jgi:hypothetical protein
MTQRSSFRPLWLIALVTLAPVGIAVVAYYGPWDRSSLPLLPGSRELIDPPVALPPLELLTAADRSVTPGSRPYRWSLIYARMRACDARCAREIERLNEVYLALGRDTDRVRRVYLDGIDGADQAADFAVVRLDEMHRATLSRALGEEALGAGRVLIADPLGRLVVSYPSDVAQKELLRDLERLLDVSRIG